MRVRRAALALVKELWRPLARRETTDVTIMSKRPAREDAPSGARVCHPAPEIKCTSLQPDGTFKEFNLSDHRGRYAAACARRALLSEVFSLRAGFWASSVYGV